MEIINITDEIIEVNVTEAIVNVVTQDGAYPLPSNVFSVFGRVGNVVGQAGDYNTDLVGEGLINKYYTDARSRAAISENITGLEYSSASGIFSLASGYLIPTQAMLDAKVPYTGATGNVTLGEHQLSAGQVAFDQTPTGAAGVGIMRWNDTDGTLDLGLKGGNVTLQIGQEQVKRIVNGAGINLTEAAYQVVKVIGAQGQRLQVALAQANNDLNSATALGIVTENINNNQEGFITTSGEVREINTTGSLQGETWADGDILYLSPSTAGKITNIKPVAPNHMVILGYVEYAHSQHGKIFVKIDNGYEIGELHDVNTTGEATNDGLFLDSDGVWKPKTIAEVLGYTPVTSARTISTTSPLTGGGDLSADRTISMPAATTSVSGYLTSTDWNTFNNKEGAIAAGTTAQYYRGDKTFQTLDTLAVPENTNLYYTQARFDTAFSGKTTTDLAEGTNLYFTTARAQAAISGTLPISVSGGVVSISQASGSSNGYLSSTDWNTFNAKQAALNGTGFVKISGTTISYDNSTYLTTIEGITAGGELSGTYASPSLVNSAVTGKILSGVNITGGTIADTDSILTAFGKLQNQINGLIGSSIYEGTWNASTNTPTLASGVGTQGSYYIVSVAGSTNIDGITDWNVGDWIIFDGTAWQQVDNTDAVVSVNGETGAVSLTTSNIAEGTNLYFTNARAIASTLTGYTSGAGTISSSDTILQAIQKLNGNVSGLVTGVSSVFGRTGAVTAQSGDYTTTQVTEGTNLYYTEARVSANTDVAANTAARHAAVTLGTANGLSLSTQQLSLGLASGSATGALSSTDWNTFNNKQAALTIGNITSADTSVMTISGGTGAIIGSGVSLSLLAATGTNGGIVTTGTQTFAGAKTFSGALSGTSATFSGAVITSGATLSSWGSTLTPALETINGNTISSYNSAGIPALYIASNAYHDGTNFVRKTANSAFLVSIDGYNSSFQLQSATSSTAGSSISWTSRFFVNGTNGNVGIGTSSPTAISNYTTLDVRGTNGSLLYMGTASTASLRLIGEGTDAYIDNLTASGSLLFRTGAATERMRILSNGQLLVGDSSSPSTSFKIDSNGHINIRNGFGLVSRTSSTELWGLGDTDFNVLRSGTFGIATFTARDMFFATNNTERMRITSGGDICIASTAPVSTRRELRIGGNAAGSRISLGLSGTNYSALVTDSGGNFYMANEYNDANIKLLMINYNNGVYLSQSATSWTANSDERLKEINGTIENALEKIMTLRAVNFSWKSDESKKEVFGFIAQDVEKVFPQVIDKNKLVNQKTEIKDETEYLGVRYQELTPVNTKAIQELYELVKIQQQTINELKSKIA